MTKAHPEPSRHRAGASTSLSSPKWMTPARSTARRRRSSARGSRRGRRRVSRRRRGPGSRCRYLPRSPRRRPRIARTISPARPRKAPAGVVSCRREDAVPAAAAAAEAKTTRRTDRSTEAPPRQTRRHGSRLRGSTCTPGKRRNGPRARSPSPRAQSTSGPDRDCSSSRPRCSSRRRRRRPLGPTIVSGAASITLTSSVNVPFPAMRIGRASGQGESREKT